MRKADTTRKYILEKSFDLIYVNGYQATSIDRILETTKVTKGAFYYHFKNKEEMGIAMVKAIIFPKIKSGLVLPLAEYSNPLEGIFRTIEKSMLRTNKKELHNGSPLNNIIQEMAAINRVFLELLSMITGYWEKALITALKKAQEEKRISTHHDLSAIAKFIIASYLGAMGSGKLYRNHSYYEDYLSQLKNYLNSLHA